MSETRGFLKALIDTENDRILGFTALGAEAGEIATVQIAMLAGLPYTLLVVRRTGGFRCSFFSQNKENCNRPTSPKTGDSRQMGLVERFTIECGPRKFGGFHFGSATRDAENLAIHHFKGLSRILWVAAPGRNGVRAFVTHDL